MFLWKPGETACENPGSMNRHLLCSRHCPRCEDMAAYKEDSNSYPYKASYVRR
uniref:Uncharacterized protein n=1 Tax=Equus asinus TaxID=9793 RepID=A0A8C4MIH9_EQUAS